MIYNKRRLVVFYIFNLGTIKNFNLSDMANYYSNINGNIASKINSFYEFWWSA